MVPQGSGVILMLSTPASRMPGPGYLGHSVACGAVETFKRHLAGELGASGIRVVCIRSHAIPEATAMGSHSRDVFQQVAERGRITVERLLAAQATGMLLKRLPTLTQVANSAVFPASDHAGAMTGAVANLTGGATLDQDASHLNGPWTALAAGVSAGLRPGPRLSQSVDDGACDERRSLYMRRSRLGSGRWPAAAPRDGSSVAGERSDARRRNSVGTTCMKMSRSEPF